MQTPAMSLMNWVKARLPRTPGRDALIKARNTVRNTTLPLISPRRGRRVLRRQQLFGIVRESMIRGGVISTSYTFKVLALDNNGDSFLVLMDLGLGSKDMPDEYLLEIERWIEQSAKARHDLVVRSVYWRRVAQAQQAGVALRASVPVQVRREAETSAPAPLMPEPAMQTNGIYDPVGADEIAAFRRALQATTPVAPAARASAPRQPTSSPEFNSDFAALSETQYGKL